MISSTPRAGRPDLHPAEEHGCRKREPEGGNGLRPPWRTSGPANAGDIGRLTQRSTVILTEFALALEVLADPSHAHPAWREDALRGLPRRVLGGPAWQAAERCFGAPQAVHLPPRADHRSVRESRSAKQFTAEVDRFVNAAKKGWPAFSISKFIEAGPPELKLTVMNHTDDNFEDVVVEVTLPSRACWCM